MYYKDSQTGQIFKVNGNTNQIEIVSSVPAGTSLSQGQTMSQVANSFGVSLPGGQAPAGSNGTPAVNNAPAPLTTTQTQTNNNGGQKPVIPNSAYQQIVQQIENGTISNQSQAEAKINSLIQSGQYADSSIDYSRLFPSGTTFPRGFSYTLPGGQTYTADSTGKMNQSTTNTQTNNGGNQGGGTTSGTGLIDTNGNYTWVNTGNSAVDTLGNSMIGLINNQRNNGNVLAPGLQVTPALVSQFLQYAHSVVDPQTQQTLQNEMANISSDLSAQAKNLGLSEAGIIRDFGTSLATEQNSAGASGNAFSGQRALNENLMVDTTNQQLQSAENTASYNMGNSARTAAALVGSGNAAGLNASDINMPGINSQSVSLTGGARGSSTTGGGLGFNYTPSLYTIGTLPSAGNTNLANQQANYLTQYNTLAANQSSAQPQDIVKQLTGLPANALT